MTSITKLPVELLGLITDLLGREDLKTLRLTDSVLSLVATIKLFETLHISPNSYSFDRAHCIAARDELNQHVRTLMYHFGKLGEFHAGFESFKREYYAVRRTGMMHDPYEITSEVLWSYNCWLEEVDAQRTFELRYEAEELCDLCSRLPRLESIATVLDEASPFGDQEDYIGKRTGMAATEDDGWWRFPRLFAAAIEKPLQKISARSIQWHNLGFMEEGSEHEIQAIHERLSGLNFLELGIYRSRSDFDDENGDDSEKVGYSHHIDLLDAILGHACQLRTLKLDFDELPYESEWEATLPISKAIFKHHWPSLQELKLEAVCVQESELCEFLHGHCVTLKTLCIGDIELAKDENSDSTLDQPPSILHMFVQFRQFLRLKSCRITGNFTNRIDQAWYVNTEHKSPGCLRDLLEMFVCGTVSPLANTECGIEAAVEMVEAYRMSGEWIDLWLYGIEKGYEGFQDDSWQWAPELLP